jgi:hypothetical protein
LGTDGEEFFMNKDKKSPAYRIWLLAHFFNRNINEEKYYVATCDAEKLNLEGKVSNSEYVDMIRLANDSLINFSDDSQF